MPPNRNHKHKQNRSTGVDLSTTISLGSAKIKKKMRDISRLLKRDNLPSAVRIENERALKALTLELENVQLNLKAKKLATRYHKIKFFERKKATRRYLQAKKEYDELEKKQTDEQNKGETADSTILKELKKEIKKQRKVLRHAEIDLVYVLNFSKTEKYVSLYPSDSTEDKKELDEKAKKGLMETEKKRQEYKKKFAELMDAGELEVSIEDGLKGMRNSKVELKNQRAIDDMDEVSKDVEQGGDNESGNDDDFFE
ncbi:hypothetical protein CANARDRAFT_26180 [[Candida] arabinofermentans NRRL YB-2248]|uniref:rRNA-processing protein EFG1 n=1 Tax=[Candida] arabinofermentans NRRL YB-2248 TaxID=983967 RepID=A0A1E4T8D0_9ASCO|nr:hypothetical protein CANARDRAFT_26180 [[Candida] arabinofermentans NRRL YB-2248]